MNSSSDISNGKRYLSMFSEFNSCQTITNVFIRLQNILNNQVDTGLKDVLMGIQQNIMPWTREDLGFRIKPLQIMSMMNTDQVSILFVQILIEIIQNLLVYCGNETKILKRHFTLNLVECSCHVVVKVAARNQQFYDCCYHLLQLCTDALINSENSESLPPLSAAFYNVAGLLYKVDLHHALKYAVASESVYKEYLNLQNKSINWINLVKKQDMVASIQLSLSQKGDGIIKWIEIIQSIPVKEWTVFSEDLSDAYLLKTIQRYVKAVSASKEDYHYIIDLIQKESIKEDIQYRIMDFELNTLLAFNEYTNTSKLQIPILKRMLDLSVDQDATLRYF